MSLTLPPRFKEQMLAAIGDIGSGMPFDELRLELQDGRAMLTFCRGGVPMVRQYADETSIAVSYATGLLRV